MMVNQHIEICAYNPRWVLDFEAERDRISQVLGRLARRIDHHGSTAVPGLEAKPVLYMQVSVDELNPIRAYAEPVATIGYWHDPHPDDAVRTT